MEATKRGMAWDLLLAKKIRRSARFCRVRISFLNRTEKPDPKQVYRRACREISGNGKFGEGYLMVHDASAWQFYYYFANLRSDMINMRPPG